MDINEIAAELRRLPDLEFLFVAKCDDGPICAHGPDIATAFKAAVSAYSGEEYFCPYAGEPLDERTEYCIRSVLRLTTQLKRNQVPFVLAWHLPDEEVARLDCGGDVNVRDELIECLTGELQVAFPF